MLAEDPANGPRILFFSGGSALNGLGAALKHSTHRSIHLVTPFDSGGSSAALRRAFGMPAIGDLRSRLVALADDSVCGHPEIVALFQQRLPASGELGALRAQLRALADGSAASLRGIPAPVAAVFRELLGGFLGAMPGDFDLRGASIGNLILAGGYLRDAHDLGPVIAEFSRMIQVRGTVRPVVDAPLHLAVRLRDGREVLGQHRITGKEVAPLSSPVEELLLSARPDVLQPVVPAISDEVRQLIASADLICFPPGSFFSSLLANLLPAGVGRAIAASSAPKVYIPNLGCDPEQLGYGVADCLQRLRAQLLRDAGALAPVVNLLLVDRQHDRYLGMPTMAQREAWGLQLVEADLVAPAGGHYYDNERLAAALLGLSRPGSPPAGEHGRDTGPED